jgi:REP element-mobilizing transposase RayT
MARQLRIEYPGAFYHVTSRGNERRAIFKNQRDRAQFLSYLESATRRYGALIHVYCLMDNHYHLLVETPSGNLSRIMQHINGAYTTYFNVKRQRSGHLFQGRYKAILVHKDEYAKELSRYIHLNPVRAGIEQRPEAYKWSSYVYYAGYKKSPQWLVRDFILGYFDSKISVAQRRYRNFVRALIGQEYKSPLDDVVHSIFLGHQNFVNEIKDKFLQQKKADRNLPVLKELSNRPSLDQISAAVESVLGSNQALSKKVKLYFCHRYSGEKLKDIGVRFGIGDSGVSQSSRRILEKIQSDKKLIKNIRLIEKKLNLSNV